MQLARNLLSIYPWLLGKLVTQAWYWVIIAWVITAIIIRILAPSWQSIAADGDLAFLPSDSPSSQGRLALERAFPGSNSQSQLYIVVSRAEQKLTSADLALALDLARRLHWLAAQSSYKKIEMGRISSPDRVGKPVSLSRTAGSPTAAEKDGRADKVAFERAMDNLRETVGIEQDLSRFLEAQDPVIQFDRLLPAYVQLASMLNSTEPSDEVQELLATAEAIRDQGLPLLDSSAPEWTCAIRDVWTWRHRVVGHKLSEPSGQAKLICLQLDSEFMAVANIALVNQLEQKLRELKSQYGKQISSDLELNITGSAAIGADVLRAAASSIRKTEIVTVIMVLGILAVIYRSPILVLVPIASIVLSLIVSLGVVALLARNPNDANSWGLGVFTTTRIFIVVLLFGAGTDFCLFLMARQRELQQQQPVFGRTKIYRQLANCWRSVHMAILASAATTIVGLGLMWFSRFQKFQYSGPIIAICLLVTVSVCLTFTPALLAGLGSLAFGLRQVLDSGKEPKQPPMMQKLWNGLAGLVVQRPKRSLLLGSLILMTPAYWGLTISDRVTYDLTGELSDNSPSCRGQVAIDAHFSTTEGDPLTVLCIWPTAFADDESLRQVCSTLAAELYVDGVTSVRCLTDPLGDYPPGRKMGLVDSDAWRRRMLVGHRITRERYVSSVSQYANQTAKFDLTLRDSPFSEAASQTVDRVRKLLERSLKTPGSLLPAGGFEISGTAVGIQDLRNVTQGDQRRIQILVSLGVWLVLLLLLKRWELSTFLMITVLASYFATLGVTHWIFGYIYNHQFDGLDWKVPLYLFVILVAVGQDYNVYLVTRIREEIAVRPHLEAIHRSVAMTGGIITSCGVIMAATFFAMTSPAISLWLSNYWPQWFSDREPVLRGTSELGFALSFGILLDTVLVRSILVPAYISLRQRCL